MARIIRRVRITDNNLFLDGDEFPFHLEKQGPTISEVQPDGITRILTLPVLTFTDDTEIIDERTGG